MRPRLHHAKEMASPLNSPVALARLSHSESVARNEQCRRQSPTWVPAKLARRVRDSVAYLSGMRNQDHRWWPHYRWQC